MIHASTLPEAFETHLESGRGINFIEGNQRDVRINYATLYERSLGILYHLQNKGIQPDSELVVLVNSNQQFIDVFWAAIFGRIIPVPLAAGISSEHREKIFRVFQLLENPYLYTTRENLDRLIGFGESEGRYKETTALKERAFLIDEIEDISTPGQSYSSSPFDTAFILPDRPVSPKA